MAQPQAEPHKGYHLSWTVTDRRDQKGGEEQGVLLRTVLDGARDQYAVITMLGKGGQV